MDRVSRRTGDTPRSTRALWSALVALHLPACGSCDFDEHVRDAAGSGARNCGTFNADELSDAGHECAVDAFRNHKAFFVLFTEAGVDSNVRRAMVGTAQGRVSFFLYDSSPGGGGDGDPTIDQWQCRDPFIEQARGGVLPEVVTPGTEILACRSTTTPIRVCE